MSMSGVPASGPECKPADARQSLCRGVGCALDWRCRRIFGRRWYEYGGAVDAKVIWLSRGPSEACAVGGEAQAWLWIVSRGESR